MTAENIQRIENGLGGSALADSILDRIIPSSYIMRIDRDIFHAARKYDDQKLNRSTGNNDISHGPVIEQLTLDDESWD